MERTNTNPNRDFLLIGVLVILYLVGIAGVLIPISDDFLSLTPMNLLVSLCLMLWAQRNKSKWFYAFLGIGWAVGFGIEAIGVNTGMPFGEYSYGTILGPKLLATPLMIGVNWLLLTIAAASVVQLVLPNLATVWKPLLAAILMVALDLVIEPVAIETGMWTWLGGTPPVQNYIAWFLVAYPLQRLFFDWNLAEANKVGAGLFLLQVLFFSVLLIF